MSISGTTKIFVIFAHPAEQVRAPTLFNKKFEELRIDSVMIPIDVPPSHLKDCVYSMRGIKNLRGGVVTIPHKVEIAKLCDKLGAGGKATGAVNAIRFEEDGILHGDNFDGIGFVAGLKDYGHLLKDKKILIVGAGGASRALAVELISEPIKSLNITNRSFEKAKKVVQTVKSVRQTDKINAIEKEHIDYAEYDFVINATSLGMKSDDPLPFPIISLRPDCVVCDIIMKPQETKLLSAAKRSGIKVHYGKHMLDYQVSFIADFIGAFKT
ncbi:MAG: shikimate dehydrogenase [Alphaproteobacteria bacterium]|nr:MAG: shikimate dehydrogenase [Alphaproteobacteria bacterium]